MTIIGSMPKLIVIYQGGLGNQLFIHAAFLQLAAQSDYIVEIDKQSRFETDLKYKRAFRLDEIGFKLERRSAHYMLRSDSRLIRGLARYVLPHLGLAPRIISDRNYHAKLDGRKDYGNSDIIMDGYFQVSDLDDDVYVSMYRSINKGLLDIARSRYGDLLADPEQTPGIFHIRLFTNSAEERSLMREYFHRSTRFLIEKVNLRKLFVIGEMGDAVVEIMEGLPEGFHIEYLAPKSDIEDMLLISQFKYIICSRSSFSWWCAKLGETSGNTKLVVISGTKNTQGNYKWQPDRISCQGWMVI